MRAPLFYLVRSDGSELNLLKKVDYEPKPEEAKFGVKFYNVINNVLADKYVDATHASRNGYLFRNKTF
jgi:hypothetical protein